MPGVPSPYLKNKYWYNNPNPASTRPAAIIAGFPEGGCAVQATNTRTKIAKAETIRARSKIAAMILSSIAAVLSGICGDAASPSVDVLLSSLIGDQSAGVAPMLTVWEIVSGATS